MTTDNPTPTPLASTAMAAAREKFAAMLFSHQTAGFLADDWEEFCQSTEPQDQSLVRTIYQQADKSVAIFQPLLAKVEGERDEHIRIALSCGQSTVQGLKDSLLREMHIRNQKDLPAGFDSWSSYHESIVKLRADLAAKEAALGAALQTAAIHGASNAELEVIHSLASRADKGGAK